MKDLIHSTHPGSDKEKMAHIHYNTHVEIQNMMKFYTLRNKLDKVFEKTLKVTAHTERILRLFWKD
jgi:hypothetical protein